MVRGPRPGLSGLPDRPVAPGWFCRCREAIREPPEDVEPGSDGVDSRMLSMGRFWGVCCIADSRLLRSRQRPAARELLDSLSLEIPKGVAYGFQGGAGVGVGVGATQASAGRDWKLSRADAREHKCDHTPSGYTVVDELTRTSRTAGVPARHLVRVLRTTTRTDAGPYDLRIRRPVTTASSKPIRRGTASPSGTPR